MNRFLDQDTDNWQRLEGLLDMMKVSGLRALSRVEVRELGELYRRAASDLAIARAETRDPKLINYLNGLVTRAHGRIYRAEGQGLSQIWHFFTVDLPATFRKNWRAIAISIAIFLGFALFGFAATWIDSDFTNFVGLAGIAEEVRTGNHWWESLNGANQIGASFIMTNNILVMLRLFAFGVFFGVGAIYGLASEGARFGSVFAVCYKMDADFGNALATFVVGHGVIELSCLCFCAAAGMIVGYSLIAPGDMTRSAAAKQKGIEAVKIAIGCACFLVVAGTIEGFLSPSSLPAPVKVGTGIVTGIALYSYLLFVGRNRRVAEKTAHE